MPRLVSFLDVAFRTEDLSVPIEILKPPIMLPRVNMIGMTVLSLADISAPFAPALTLRKSIAFSVLFPSKLSDLFPALVPPIPTRLGFLFPLERKPR
jgi:hypothetical protein